MDPQHGHHTTYATEMQTLTPVLAVSLLFLPCLPPSLSHIISARDILALPSLFAIVLRAHLHLQADMEASGISKRTFQGMEVSNNG